MENNWWHLARNRIIQAELQKRINPDDAILDVGCGRGVAVKYLRDAGLNCTGVETSNTRPISGTASYITYRIKAQELPVEKRDKQKMILVLDVIEHIPDPVTFLDDLCSAFVNLQSIIITVPGRPELWSNYDQFYGHQRRYTIKMIEDLAGQIQWDLLWRSYFFHGVYLPAKTILGSGLKRAVGMTAPPKFTWWVHKIIARAFVLEYNILPNNLPGTSIIACLSVSQSPKL
ncbi:class I SAM-dependent methyltransferase [Chloroflexota bacterium]